MNRSRWVVASLLFALAVAGIASAAKDAPAGKTESKAEGKTDSKKGKAGAGADKPSGLPPGVTLNACGCYQKPTGCVCTSKKAKCECPGECEPAGCEQQRDKELQKEYAAEVKRAQDDDKKRAEAETKRAQDEEKKRQAAEAAAEKKRAEAEAASDESAAAAPADEEKSDSKTKKPAAKDAKKK